MLAQLRGERRATWRGWARLVRVVFGSMVMAGVWWPGGAVAAQDDGPLEEASPSSVGLPGRELVVRVLGWGMWLGLAACGLAVLYGAATWAGFGSASAGRAVHGKTYVFAGLIGAVVIGLAPTAVSMLFDAGQG